MPRNVGKITAIPIGLDDVHFALLLSDVKDSDATYSTPEYLARSLKITLTPILKEGTLDSDDSVEIDESNIIGYEVNFETSQLDTYVRAKILGHRVDSNGMIVYSKDDVPPKIALLGRSLLSDRRNFEYFALYKGSFKEPSKERETDKRDSTTYKTETINGKFYAREADGLIKITLNTSDDGASAEIVSAWFTEVQKPSFENAASTEPVTEGTDTNG